MNHTGQASASSVAPAKLSRAANSVGQATQALSRAAPATKKWQGIHVITTSGLTTARSRTRKARRGACVGVLITIMGWPHMAGRRRRRPHTRGGCFISLTWYEAPQPGSGYPSKGFSALGSDLPWNSYRANDLRAEARLGAQARLP